MGTEPVQEASWAFFLAVAAAYLAACGLWLGMTSRLPRSWPPKRDLRTDRRWVDFGLAIVAVAAILLLGAAYRQGYLLPRAEGVAGRVTWALNTLIIYSPIAVVLAARRQRADTVFLSGAGLARKIAFGLGAGVVSVTLFHALRGDPGLIPRTLARAAGPDCLGDGLPVFLEGVALAFLFVRLRWAVGLRAAIVVPCLLFALAHVPGQVEEGRGGLEIAAFFAFNALLPAAVLYVAQRSQDVTWLGIVHYLMDVAIEAI